MPISNDPGGSGWSGPFADLLRLQTEFQSRLGEETIRYLRRLQGALGPAAPGTVVVARAGHELSAQATPGGTAELTVELENLQRVHAVVSPQLTPLVSDAGATWFPAVESGSAFRILAPGATESVVLRVEVPTEVPEGVYRGAVLLVGFREGALAVNISIQGKATGEGKLEGKGKGKGQTGGARSRARRRPS
jgi:hypothetical protein